MKAKAIFFLPLLVLVSLFSACEEDDLRTISFDDSEIQYHRSVTRMQANKVGRYLKDNGFFEKGNRQEVIISKNDLDYELKWEVASAFIPTPEALMYYYELKDSLKKNVLEKNEVYIVLYAERNRYEQWPLKGEIPPYFKSQNHIIYYDKSVDLETVQEFGLVLDEQDFFNPEGEVFKMEQERNRIYLGLASANQKSNEFKKQFSELRSNMLQKMEEEDAGLVFEIRGPLLDGIEESISSPFYPKTTSVNGIKIKYDLSITNDDISALRNYIRNKRLRDPDWLVFIRTNESGAGRYKLIIPVEGSVNDPSEIESAKNMARAVSQGLFGSYVDVELLDEKNDRSKLIKSESM